MDRRRGMTWFLGQFERLHCWPLFKTVGARGSAEQVVQQEENRSGGRSRWKILRDRMDARRAMNFGISRLPALLSCRGTNFSMVLSLHDPSQPSVQEP
jgi:hypothetical protein